MLKWELEPMTLSVKNTINYHLTKCHYMFLMCRISRFPIAHT